MSPTSVTILAATLAGQTEGDIPYPTGDVASSTAFITIPIGILLLILATVFWRGKYLGLVAGYKEYGVEQPKRMGHFVGSLVGALGIFQLVFPLLVRAWGQGAFIAFVFVVVGIGVLILVGGAYFERG
ncbi:MAG: hypothetical protein GF400_02365 [Candidatus Eisenbacteria bacterium]|nr:hypothetical protein [Candidatus Eisenbacteria bacterium]